MQTLYSFDSAHISDASGFKMPVGPLNVFSRFDIILSLKN